MCLRGQTVNMDNPRGLASQGEGCKDRVLTSPRSPEPSEGGPVVPRGTKEEAVGP